MRYIELSGERGKCKRAMVDDDDYEFLSRLKWYLNKGYAVHLVTDDEKVEVFHMHNVVVGRRKGLVVDHINRNRLDNRKSNLRHVTRRLNARNSGLQKNNTSGYKGVWKNGNKWAARLTINKKHIHLGSYDSPEAASKAFEEACIPFDNNNLYTVK